MAAIQFTLNGKPQTVDAVPAMPLLWVLRDSLGLNRNQVWLRNGDLRRVHGAYQRAADALLLHAAFERGGQARHHH